MRVTASVLSTAMVVSTLFAGSAFGEVHKLASGTSYHCWVPADADPNVRHLLVVACHGHGQTGGFAGQLIKVLRSRQIPAIVVAPTFPWSDRNQQLISAEMLEESMGLQNEVVADVKQKWLVHPRICIFGFSVGSCYAHYFSQKQAASVMACAGLSYSGVGSPGRAAKDIAYLVACGTKDSYFEKTKEWYEKMRSAQYTSVTADWENGVGHAITPKMLKLSADLFARAYEAGPGSRVQLGRVTFWFQEAAALEEMNEALIPLAMKRLRAGAKDPKNPDHAPEAERLLKAVECWAAKRMAQIEKLLNTTPARGLELLKKTSNMLKGDPLGEAFAKRFADTSGNRELRKEIAADLQFERLAESYRKRAERFRKPDDPKAIALRQQFQMGLDAFIKSHANTLAAARAEKMKRELSDPAGK